MEDSLTKDSSLNADFDYDYNRKLLKQSIKGRNYEKISQIRIEYFYILSRLSTRFVINKKRVVIKMSEKTKTNFEKFLGNNVFEVYQKMKSDDINSGIKFEEMLILSFFHQRNIEKKKYFCFGKLILGDYSEKNKNYNLQIEENFQIYKTNRQNVLYNIDNFPEEPKRFLWESKKNYNRGDYFKNKILDFFNSSSADSCILILSGDGSQGIFFLETDKDTFSLSYFEIYELWMRRRNPKKKRHLLLICDFNDSGLWVYQNKLNFHFSEEININIQASTPAEKFTKTRFSYEIANLGSVLLWNLFQINLKVKFGYKKINFDNFLENNFISQNISEINSEQSDDWDLDIIIPDFQNQSKTSQNDQESRDLFIKKTNIEKNIDYSSNNITMNNSNLIQSAFGENYISFMGFYGNISKIFKINVFFNSYEDMKKITKFYAKETINSDIIFGECDTTDNKITGKGIKFCGGQNEEIYEGEFENSIKNGKGINYFSFGDYYLGEFAKDSFEGIGILIVNKKKRFVEREIKNGKNILVQKMFKCNKIEEDETLKTYIEKYSIMFGITDYVNVPDNFPDLMNHEVDRHFSKIFANYYVTDDEDLEDIENYVYLGNFKENFFHINGIKCDSEGVYVGSFKEGVKCGFGIFFYSECDIYFGEFDEDMKNGQGILLMKNGDTYEGKFENDKRHGEGIYKSSDGGWIYRGKFVNNLRQGEGEIVKRSRNKSLKNFLDENEEIAKDKNLIFSKIKSDLNENNVHDFSNFDYINFISKILIEKNPDMSSLPLKFKNIDYDEWFYILNFYLIRYNIYCNKSSLDKDIANTIFNILEETFFSKYFNSFSKEILYKFQELSDIYKKITLNIMKIFYVTFIQKFYIFNQKGEPIFNLNNIARENLFLDFIYYKGYFVMDKFEGSGKIFYIDSSEYEGEFKNGLRHGKGKFINSNKEIYEGEFSSNLKTGDGKIQYMDGSTYEGNWKNDKKNGKGILSYKNGDVYIGEFLDDLRHGIGELIIPGKCEIYECNWDSDVMDGLGKITRDGKIIYEGTFRNNFEYFNGRYFNNEIVYIGEMFNNVFQGEGYIIYFNGDNYKGNFRNGKKEGNGTFFTKEYIYNGTFLDDNFHGAGKLKFLTNMKYEGNFVNGMYHGYGILHHSDGSIYKGYFENGKKHGNGTYIWPDGININGEWFDDKKI